MMRVSPHILEYVGIIIVKCKTRILMQRNYLLGDALPFSIPMDTEGKSTWKRTSTDIWGIVLIFGGKQGQKRHCYTEVVLTKACAILISILLKGGGNGKAQSLHTNQSF